MKNQIFEKNTRPSISENNGIAALSNEDLSIYSIGISTGGLAEMRMAMANPNRHIIATTIDCDGAKFAQTQIDQMGLSKRISVKIEDATNPLPYPNQCFDFIYARLVLHYLPKSDLIKALGELHRVLKVGGKFFVVVRSSNCPEALDIDSTFDANTGMTTYMSNGHSYSRYFHTEGTIENYLISSGFCIKYVRSYKEQLCMDFQRLQPAKQIDTLIEVLASK